MKKLRKVYIGLILVFLYAPIALLILYSFNDSKSRAAWGGFTLRWYQELLADETILSALGTTLSIGLLAAANSSISDTPVTTSELSIGRLTTESIAWRGPRFI